MKKEEIYLDLSKLSEEEKEYIEDVTDVKTKDRGYIHYNTSINNWFSFDEWGVKPFKTEITFNQFKELFEPSYKKGDIVICSIDETEYIVKLNSVKNVSAEKYIVRYSNGSGYSSINLGGCFDKILRFANEEEMNLIEPKNQYTIHLDKTKAYDLRDLNEDKLQIIMNHLREINPIAIYLSAKDQLKSFKRNIFLLCGSSANDWYFSSCLNGKKLINALTLFEPQLKIGDTFEHNGFICEVKEPVKKWYKVYNKELDIISFEKETKQQSELYSHDPHLSVIEITDQEFINQLEKNAR